MHHRARALERGEERPTGRCLDDAAAECEDVAVRTLAQELLQHARLLLAEGVPAMLRDKRAQVKALREHLVRVDERAVHALSEEAANVRLA